MPLTSFTCRHPRPTFVVGTLLMAAVAVSAPALADEISSDWVDGYNARTRLTAVRSPKVGAGNEITAFIEIEMPKGWKTYWKAPGESGVPPAFDFTESENVAAATVLYPVPHRLVDKGGETVGYKDRVAFPVLISAGSTDKPVALDVAVQFGLCKEICIPAEVKLTLDVPPDANGELSHLAGVSLASVPRTPETLRPEDPVLKSARLDMASGRPRLLIEATFPGGGDKADVFLEAPGGAYMPPARKISEDGAALVFESDLSADVDLDELRGKEIGVTLAGANGQSATTFVLQ